MKIVVNIPDSVYNTAKRYAKDKHCIKIYEVNDILNAIANGTPLPKGHGRLIDASELNVALLMGELYGNKTAIQVIDKAPTIIEADREEQE